MKIGIIGGGAAGLATAFFLGDNHDVTLFEKQSYLGGNVRTLGRNVIANGLENGVVTENGVCCFFQDLSPLTHRLFDALGMDCGSRHIDSTIFFRDGKSLHTSTVDSQRTVHPPKFTGELHELAGQLVALCETELAGLPISSVFPRSSSIGANWFNSICMATYSMPFHAISSLPAEIAIPVMIRNIVGMPFTVLRTGAYSYMEKMIERLKCEVFVGALVRQVNRNTRGVEVIFEDGQRMWFDKIVFATTPGQVLRILGDPTPEEVRRFRNWNDSVITTTAHRDHLLNGQRGRTVSTGTAFFEKADGEFGYNFNVNTVYGNDPNCNYSYGANIDEFISPDLVLERHAHTTPAFTVEAAQFCAEIIETNGTNHTFHCGAYQGNGIHEAAIESALRISQLLGGQTI